MKRIIFSVALCALFILFALTSYSFVWPSEPGTSISSFGSFSIHAPSKGIDFSCEDSSVSAISEGTVFFVWEEGQHPSDLPSGLGNWVAVEHSRSIVSVYSRLATGSISENLQYVREGDVLGRAGRTGFSLFPGVSVMIYDRVEHQIVNPLVFLPEDRNADIPEISSISIASGKTETLLVPRALITQGTYDLWVELVPSSDQSDFGIVPAPYSLVVYIDGIELSTVVFDVITVSDGHSLVSGDKPFAVLYDKKGRIRISNAEFPSGTILLEIVVRNYFGKSNKYTLSFESR